MIGFVNRATYGLKLRLGSFRKPTCSSNSLISDRGKTSNNIRRAIMDSSIIKDVKNNAAEEGRKEGEESSATIVKKQDAPGWGETGPTCWKCRGSGKKPSRSPKQEEVTCPVCFGAGRLQRKKLRETKTEEKRANKMQRTTPADYVIPGPPCSANPIEIDSTKEELCSLLGHWRILQSLRGGHRWSTDDLLTAWVACTEFKKTFNGEALDYHLDLGCGIGTVLLMTSWFFYKDKPTGVGIEAQSASASKARRNIEYNGVKDRLSIIESDFREVTTERLGNPPNNFRLVTGTPPYFPVEFTSEGKALPAYGGMPTFEQSAPARFEFRGGIASYVETASKFVRRPDGLVVLCEGNLSPSPKHLDRIQTACKAHGLSLKRTVMVHGREDKSALFAVHVLVPQESVGVGGSVDFVEEKFDVRHVGGKRTKQYLDMCLEMGVAPFSDDEN